MVKTCFVISQIGEEGSQERKHADDVFDLIIQPSLEKFGFETKRADHIFGTSSITADIIRSVQDADLCIIDLTGKNPNVYYECGRRHENGKPFIQLIRSGEKMPFDVSDIRTIIYKIDDPREIRKASLLIQSYVSEVVAEGLSSTSSATTMSAILDSLNKIERRLSAMENKSHTSYYNDGQHVNGFDDLIRNPVESFQDAFIKGDIGRIINLLPRLELLRTADEFVAIASVIAMQGIDAGGEALVRTIQKNAISMKIDALKAGITALGQYYIANNNEKNGSDILEEMCIAALNRQDISDEDKAYIHNQLGMVFYHAGKYDKSMSETEKACTLRPKDPSYQHNMSVIYEKLNIISKAVEYAIKSLELGDGTDADHLSHAYGLFVKNGMISESEDVIRKLEKVDKNRAMFARRTNMKMGRE